MNNGNKIKVEFKKFKLSVGHSNFEVTGFATLLIKQDSTFDYLDISISKLIRVYSEEQRVPYTSLQRENFKREIIKYPQFVWECDKKLRRHLSKTNPNPEPEFKNFEFIEEDAIESRQVIKSKNDGLTTRQITINNFIEIAYPMFMADELELDEEDLAVMWLAYLKRNEIKVHEDTFMQFCNKINAVSNENKNRFTNEIKEYFLENNL